MTTFRVWAPNAHETELVLDDERRPMEPQPGGWWALVVPEAEPGVDYAYSLDGGPPLPDPRSRWQPHGVHGPSRLVDLDAFVWGDARWNAPPLRRAVIYELHVGAFTPEGTFNGVVGKLDYLRGLGVTHVELMPVAQFPGRHGWGYDGVDLYAPHQAYGGPAGLQRLVNACHQKGIAVLLDVVYNHLGPDGNYLAQFGPYFTDRYRTPWGEAVNLDGPGSHEVRRFFIDNALMWLRDYHVDGLRLDAIHALTDHSAVHFLTQLGEEVAALEQELGRRLVLIAESDLNDPRVVRPVAAGGYGLCAQWSDDFHHALHTVLTGEQAGYYADFGALADLATALQRAYVYAGQFSTFRNRPHGAPPTTVAGGRDLRLLPGDRFVGYLQNHDQVGNRALGERISHLVDAERVKVGAALMLTAPFVPLLFQGEEWGASSPFLYFVDHEAEALAEAVRTGRQREFARFGWLPEQVPDPQDEATFRRAKLDWDEWQRDPHQGLMAWYRRLIRLRREHPALREYHLATVQVDFNEEARWLVLHRPPLAVVCNLADEPQTIPLPDADGYRLLLSSQRNGDRPPASDGVTLPGPSVAILEHRTA